MGTRTPDITVIIGAYNAMPYLSHTLTSLLEQSLGRERLEVIAVDDGSTDGTGEELERFAAAHPALFTVLHQKNSGGPAEPRNVGLNHARGRFVFFLDADDFLGPEALERMLSAAETNDTDVVLGKMVGVNGRGAPASMFRENQPRTDVFSSRVYWTLSPLKLFRRELIERLGLRFATGYAVCEDQPFTAMAYLHANGISVVADYDCVHIVKRDDGGNITSTTRGADQRIRALDMMIDLVEEHTDPGAGRDALMHRHFSIDVCNALIHLAQESDPVLQQKNFAELRCLVERIGDESLVRRLGTVNRLRHTLITRGLLDGVVELERVDEAHRADGTYPDIVLDGGRAYAQLPFFRDPHRGIPDEAYDVTSELPGRHRLDNAEVNGSLLTLTGHAYLRRLPRARTGGELVLRERTSKTEHRFPLTPAPAPDAGTGEDGGLYAYPDAGFEVTVDIARAADDAPLPRGLWDLFLSLDFDGGLTREIRLGNSRLPEIPSKPRTYIIVTDSKLMAAALYYTHPYDNLTLDIGENKHRVPDKIRLECASWSAQKRPVLEITGTCALSAMPTHRLTLQMTDQHGASTHFPASTKGDRFTISVPVSRLTPGTWTASLHLGADNDPGWNVPVTVRPSAETARWSRLGLPRYAKLTNANGQLTLSVDRVKISKAITNRMKR
ncbi:glycosyltransferase family 2 protein [Streptomyces sp. ISL-100]|uniref:glycosyltransferase family 2 protein n=1 Tax=Streptomyces sp. ISL-100 TaxID=2819173 RepID=UPI001BE7480D|nr:glycosyltransferase family 2 protein [Streptomyces sp. ISL-100]MBT2396452.1 glycosyltransferase [Streptomyces sp. ISL-100]